MSADMLRVVRFLVAGRATVGPVASSRKVGLESERGTIAVGQDVLASLARRGLITRSGAHVVLTDSGAAYWRRNRLGRPDFQNQHRELESRLVEVAATPSAVIVNRAESPLSLLARRRNRDGRRFLSNDEYHAGERLRSDYTRGQLMPRLGANWQGCASAGRRGGDRGGAADLTDAALAARQRVENAIRCVGPELAGVLVDICCYLKGLETVERERGWPARSAKIVLKSALSALARHYKPEGGGAERAPATLHWGTADYRPSIR